MPYGMRYLCVQVGLAVLVLSLLLAGRAAWGAMSPQPSVSTALQQPKHRFLINLILILNPKNKSTPWRKLTLSKPKPGQWLMKTPNSTRYILEGFPVITFFSLFILHFSKRNAAKINPQKHHEMHKIHLVYFSGCPTSSSEKAQYNLNRKMLLVMNTIL